MDDAVSDVTSSRVEVTRDGWKGGSKGQLDRISGGELLRSLGMVLKIRKTKLMI